MSLKLMYITNQLEIALIAEKYGVDRIWVDLETDGKEERQKERDSVKSNHTVNDIKNIAPLLTTSEMLVRINPWSNKSAREIDEVIEAGADIIMLPMWNTVEEVKNFIYAVNGRCKTILLLETKEADKCLDEVLDLRSKNSCFFDEVHIGLNDLHISYGLTFMFELLTNGTIERLCKKLSISKIPYGFGGIAKIGSGAVPAEKIITEHYRLGSTRAILSRSFCNGVDLRDIDKVDVAFGHNMKELRKYERSIEKFDRSMFEENKRILEENVRDVIQKLNMNRSEVIH